MNAPESATSDTETTETETTAPIAGVEELLAHALELEHAAEAHYGLLADSMGVHHNRDVEAVFRKLAALSAEHAAAISERAAGLELPRIAPWAFKWHCPGAPEGDNCLDGDVSYQMSKAQAVELALHNERRGHAFYRHVIDTSTDAEAAKLAREMADEEWEHVELLVALLAEQHADGGVQSAPADLDPPHMPE
jgi:rubrerythrin